MSLKVILKTYECLVLKAELLVILRTKLRDLATPEFLKITLSSNPKSKLALDKGIFG